MYFIFGTRTCLSVKRSRFFANKLEVQLRSVASVFCFRVLCAVVSNAMYRQQAQFALLTEMRKKEIVPEGEKPFKSIQNTYGDGLYKCSKALEDTPHWYCRLQKLAQSDVET